MSRWLWNLLDPAVTERNGKWVAKVSIWRRLLGVGL